MTSNAPYECIACGGPEWSQTSHSGCPTCGAQDGIVPRGTRKKIIARPQDTKHERRNDIIEHSIDGIVFARARVV